MKVHNVEITINLGFFSSSSFLNWIRLGRYAINMVGAPDTCFLNIKKEYILKVEFEV